jgi:hypothetical protein
VAPARIRSPRRRARFLASAGAVSILALGLAACGDSGSTSGSTSTAGERANARRGFLSDPKVQACLKKEGVQVPDFRRGNGNGPPNGQPPSGQPPSGQAPPNGGFRNSAQAKKLREALQKCGVPLPNRGQNGPPQQQPSDTTNS